VIKKKKYFKELKKSYRFRNLPKGHFIPKTFTTIKINKELSIIVGELKPDYEHLEGSGILDFFKKGVNVVKSSTQKVMNFIKPRSDSYNNTSQKTLDQYGNLPIKSLMICRTPILKVIDTVLNFISLGKFAELKKKYGFDQLYHLQLVANVGGKNIVIEKNEVININTSFKNDKNTETYPINLNKEFTINDMLNKGLEKVGNHLWFSYDAFHNNCQYFIKYCLEGVNLFSNEAKNFLFQDIKELAKEMPSYVKKTANVVTTTGAIVNKLTGQGEPTECECGGNKLSAYILSKIDDKKKLMLLKKIEKDFYDYVMDNCKPTKKGDYNLDKAFSEWKKDKDNILDKLI
jgi:hypothetical protein